MSEPVIRMENIVKTYYLGKPNELEILHGINLTVNKGEFVSIVGESGSGKSTLMNIIGVLDRQTQGNYYLEGQDVNGMSDEVRSAIRNRRIGFVFQNFNLLPRANALKNVMVPLLYGEEHSKNGKEHAMEMLKMVGMEDRADHRPNELSGGQKQRVAIARAMINDPAIILADEPTGALDYNTSKEILKLIENVNVKYGNTVIMVTHNEAIRHMAGERGVDNRRLDTVVLHDVHHGCQQEPGLPSEGATRLHDQLQVRISFLKAFQQSD